MTARIFLAYIFAWAGLFGGLGGFCALLATMAPGARPDAWKEIDNAGNGLMLGAIIGACYGVAHFCIKVIP